MNVRIAIQSFTDRRNAEQFAEWIRQERKRADIYLTKGVEEYRIHQQAEAIAKESEAEILYFPRMQAD